MTSSPVTGKAGGTGQPSDRKGQGHWGGDLQASESGSQGPWQAALWGWEQTLDQGSQGSPQAPRVGKEAEQRGQNRNPARGAGGRAKSELSQCTNHRPAKEKVLTCTLPHLSDLQTHKAQSLRGSLQPRTLPILLGCILLGAVGGPPMATPACTWLPSHRLSQAGQGCRRAKTCGGKGERGCPRRGGLCSGSWKKQEGGPELGTPLPTTGPRRMRAPPPPGNIRAVPGGGGGCRAGQS